MSYTIILQIYNKSRGYLIKIKKFLNCMVQRMHYAHRSHRQGVSKWLFLGDPSEEKRVRFHPHFQTQRNRK